MLTMKAFFKRKFLPPLKEGTSYVRAMGRKEIDGEHVCWRVSLMISQDVGKDEFEKMCIFLGKTGLTFDLYTFNLSSTNVPCGSIDVYVRKAAHDFCRPVSSIIYYYILRRREDIIEHFKLLPSSFGYFSDTVLVLKSELDHSPRCTYIW